MEKMPLTQVRPLIGTVGTANWADSDAKADNGGEDWGDHADITCISARML
jgi:hypothetical protein